MNDTSDETLLGFGWAPGGYYCKCKDCGVKHSAAKKAFRCKSCAERMAFVTNSMTPLPEGESLIIGNGPITIEEIVRRVSSASPASVTSVLGPITVKELAERGMDDRLGQLLHGIIGDHLRAMDPSVVIQPEEAMALGYGPLCPCAERGLRPGEKTCSNCDRCKECCDNDVESCSCEGCSCKA